MCNLLCFLLQSPIQHNSVLLISYANTIGVEWGYRAVILDGTPSLRSFPHRCLAALHRAAGPVPTPGVPPQSPASGRPGALPAGLSAGLQLSRLCGGGGGRDEKAASGLISTAEGVKVKSGHPLSSLLTVCA